MSKLFTAACELGLVAAAVFAIEELNWLLEILVTNPQ
jgi:hypothetical protein